MTEISKPKAVRVPGDVLQNVAQVIAGIGVLLFLFGIPVFAATVTIGGLLLWIVGMLKEIAWNTSPKGRY